MDFPPENKITLFSYQIGKTPLLSIAELLSFFPEKNFIDTSENNIIIQSLPLLSAQDFLNHLGGSLKISEIFQTIPLNSDFGILKNNIVQFIISNCSRNQKINFAINIFPLNQEKLLLKKLLTSIKKDLKNQKILSRFVNKNFQNISSAATYQEQLTQKNNIEFNIIFGQEKIYLGITEAVQDLDAYSFRDYEKPYRDSHSGMLPPKLAQIMINLANSYGRTARPYPPLPPTPYNLRPILYDPFCGSGTILTEGLLMGYNILGSDISEKTISLAGQNINWLRQQFKIDPTLKSELFIQDATKINPLFPNSTARTDRSRPVPTSLITEPYLGTPLTHEPNPEQINKIQSELKNLYLTFFQKLATFLLKDTPIVIIFPYIKAGNKKHFLQITSEIEKLGFKTEKIIPESLQEKFNLGLNKFPSLLYERKDQIVGREIWKFIKT